MCDKQLYTCCMSTERSEMEWSWAILIPEENISYNYPIVINNQIAA